MTVVRDVLAAQRTQVDMEILAMVGRRGRKRSRRRVKAVQREQDSVFNFSHPSPGGDDTPSYHNP